MGLVFRLWPEERVCTEQGRLDIESIVTGLPLLHIHNVIFTSDGTEKLSNEK